MTFNAVIVVVIVLVIINVNDSYPGYVILLFVSVIVILSNLVQDSRIFLQ